MVKSRLYPGGDPRASRSREREDLTSSCETRRCKSLDFTGDSRRNDVSFLKGISTGTNGYAAHGWLLNFKRSSSLFREAGCLPASVSAATEQLTDPQFFRFCENFARKGTTEVVAFESQRLRMSRARVNLIHLFVFFLLLLFHRIGEQVFEKFFSKRDLSFFKLKCNCFNTVQNDTLEFFWFEMCILYMRLFCVKCFEEIQYTFKYQYKFLIQV